MTIKPTTEKQFEALFHEYYTQVCKRIYRIVRDTGIAEDLGQQVFIKYWKQQLIGSEEHNPGAYLYRMAVNEAISHIRKNKHVLLPIDDDHTNIAEHHRPESAISPSDQSYLHRTLWNAVDHLPEKCQLIFRLCKSEGLTYSEIADYLDISEKTVENQMGRAFKYLREELQHLSPIAFILLGLYH